VPTEGNQEDVVPMGMTAAWKAGRILANAERIVAIELLAGAQGLEYLLPLTPARAVGRLHAAVRAKAAALTGDRPFTADIERIAEGIRAGTFEPEGGGEGA
jgi:histidine ammonia-lyase